MKTGLQTKQQVLLEIALEADLPQTLDLTITSEVE